MASRPEGNHDHGTICTFRRTNTLRCNQSSTPNAIVQAPVRCPTDTPRYGLRLPKGGLVPREQGGSRCLDNCPARRDITVSRRFQRRRPSDTWQPGELAPVSSQRPPGRLWYTAHTPCMPIRRQLVSSQVSSEVAPLRYIVPWQHRSTIARCAYQRDSEYSAEYVLHFGDAFTVGMERKGPVLK